MGSVIRERRTHSTQTKVDTMDKITRSADANWKGDLDNGHGLVSV